MTMKLHIPPQPEKSQLARELLDQRLLPAPVANDGIVPDHRHNGWYLVTWSPNGARKLAPISAADAARQLEHTGPAQMVVFGYLTALSAPRPAQPQDFGGQGNDGVPASATEERSEKSLGLVVLVVFAVVLIGALVYLACCKPPG